MKACKCQDWGKEFNKGDEGDNEKFCLRCDYLSRSDEENEYRDECREMELDQ